MATDYGDKSIKTLDPVTHIRLRPGMYVGEPGTGAMYHDCIYILMKEVIDNAIDEFGQGFGKRIDVNVNYDTGEVSVRDYGRGWRRWFCRQPSFALRKPILALTPGQETTTQFSDKILYRVNLWRFSAGLPSSVRLCFGATVLAHEKRPIRRYTAPTGKVGVSPALL